MQSLTVYTIGHSDHAIEEFIGLLRDRGVTAVADVRSTPYSRRNPAYNRETLAATLREQGMAYLFLGGELGGRSPDPACYEDGRVRYRLVAKTARFREGIRRLMQAARGERVALLCAERDPLDCHRTLLVGRELRMLDVEVVHIHADGQLESQEEALDRLLDRFHGAQLHLFNTREDSIQRAYDRQEKQIAYTRKPGASEDCE